MILVGTMNLTRTRQTGQFDCPTCRCVQEFRLRSRRPWLTLYFIPVAPIGAAELFVVCGGCRENWDPSVLDRNENATAPLAADEYRNQAMRSAVLIVIEDRFISETEIDTLQRIAWRLFGRSIDRDELGQLCSIAQQNRISTRNYVRTVSRRWNPSQKTEVLQAMFLAATAEGKMSEPQVKVMAELKSILDLTDDEYEIAIDVAIQWEQNE